MFVQNHHSLEELQRLTKALTKKRIWLRHQAVVLAKQGHSAPAIARALGCSHRAVQAWVGRYNQGGLAATAVNIFEKQRNLLWANDLKQLITCYNYILIHILFYIVNANLIVKIGDMGKDQVAPDYPDNPSSRC